jgi:hypothetical protein
MSISENTDDTTNVSSGTEHFNKAAETRRLANLVVGDILVFLVFSLIGRISHGEPADLTALPQVVGTAAPFAVGWFIVAPFVGAYRRDITTRPREMARRTAFAWVLACPVGLTLRGIFVDHSAPPLSFAIITLLFVLIIMLLWRWPYALTSSLKKV